jgi:hypothetical protein
MDLLRDIIMYGLATLSLAFLGLTVWHRDGKAIVDGLITTGITVCLALSVAPPLFLRGTGLELAGLVFALLAVAVWRKRGLWRREPAAKPGPPAA